jgi:hypothetical protein
MNHPDREEWIPFLFGEADPSRRKQLAAHLDSCPSCAREIAGWRRSLRALDRGPVPARPAIVVLPLVLKWAMAAVLVLGLGFWTGRTTAGSRADIPGLRAELEATIRSSLQVDLRAGLQQLQAEHARRFTAAEARLNSASTRQAQDLWSDLTQVVTSARLEDARAIRALLQETQEHNGAEFVALRKDLETLASTTDEAIRQARVHLIQLADTRKTIE